MPFHRRLSASPFTSPLRLSIGLPGFVSAALLAPSARAQPPADLPEEHAEPDAPPSIGLADAVSEALARNPTAQVAYDELERARAIVEETRANALPTLYGNVTYTRLDATRVFNGVVYAAADQLGANALLTVPIIAPRPWAQWSQAKDSVEAARASAVDTRRLVAVAVARAYLAVVAQKRVIEAVVRARDTDRAHYAYAHQRYGGGIGNRIDEVRAEQQLQSDEAIVEQQKVALARDREALGVLVGVGGPLNADEPNLQAPADAAQAMDLAEHRSDVLASGARLHAAAHAVRDDWTDYSPYLTGTFQPFYQNPPTVTLPTTGWQATLVLTLPLYDGGLRYGQEKERASLRDEAKANLDGTLRQARSDVRTAFEEVKRADVALASSRKASQLASSALELAQIAYKGGASTNIEVIDAERTARDAETAVAVAEDGARQARLDLLVATGRFP
jgi:outer membrane protein TolC